MRIGTYAGFAAGLIAGAVVVTKNAKAKQLVNETTQKVMQKAEETMTATQGETMA